MSIHNSITSIEERIERLMKLCEVYKRKIVDLEQENNRLKEGFENELKRSKNIEEKQHLSRLVENISLTNENKLDTKRKITDFVQEIEKCIEILSYNDSILK